MSIYYGFCREFDNYFYEYTGKHYIAEKELFKEIGKLENAGVCISFCYFAVDPYDINHIEYPYINVNVYENSVVDIIKMMYDDAQSRNMIFICPLSKIIKQVNMQVFSDIFRKIL